jgi:hypothetical protein
MFHVHIYFYFAWIVAPSKNANNHNYFILKFQGHCVIKYEYYPKNKSLSRIYNRTTEFTTISKASVCTKLCKKFYVLLILSYEKKSNIYDWHDY